MRILNGSQIWDVLKVYRGDEKLLNGERERFLEMLLHTFRMEREVSELQNT